jgi:hypothetical protein
MILICEGFLCQKKELKFLDSGSFTYILKGLEIYQSEFHDIVKFFDSRSESAFDGFHSGAEPISSHL